MHKEIEIECVCGFKVRLTEIQFNDFDCGMMGTFRCSNCKEILLPNRNNENIKMTTREVEGEDRGWR